jgi:hypothetical protein
LCNQCGHGQAVRKLAFVTVQVEEHGQDCTFGPSPQKAGGAQFSISQLFVHLVQQRLAGKKTIQVLYD